MIWAGMFPLNLPPLLANSKHSALLVAAPLFESTRGKKAATAQRLGNVEPLRRSGSDFSAASLKFDAHVTRIDI